MADKFASSQAEDKANELGVALEDVEATGANGATVSDVENAAGDPGKQVYVYLNPDLPGMYSYKASDGREFYRDQFYQMSESDADSYGKALSDEGVPFVLKGGEVNNG